MILDLIQVHSLRSFKSATLSFHPRYNYIIGENGSGKTTILEAIYLLGSGHSFKIREISPLIQHGQQQLILYGKAGENSLSIAKSINTPTIVKIDRQPCSTSSKLAYLLPCQIYYQDIFQIMDAGPSLRRAMIDWGMFHVKHDYLTLWKQYKQILKQRNSLLKQKPKINVLIPWDMQLAEVGEIIAEMRLSYIKSLELVYKKVLKKLSHISINLKYNKGWDKKESGLPLIEALAMNLDRDVHRGFTSVGIHQADLVLENNDTQAKKILSRGQQKIALIALKLSQSQMLTQHCIHLMDDIFAELDGNHQQKLAEFISGSQDQYFFTLLSHDQSKLSSFPDGKIIKLPLANSES